MIRARLVQMVDGWPRFATYVGPWGAWPPGWSVQAWKPAR